jgi:hypothetical protein
VGIGGNGFRQWSNKGYMHYRATVLVGKCAQCQRQSFDAVSDTIFDAAFQHEYDRLRQ